MISGLLTDVQLRAGNYYLHKVRLQISALYDFEDMKVNVVRDYKEKANIILDKPIIDKLDVNRSYYVRMQRLTKFGWTLPSEPIMFRPILGYKLDMVHGLSLSVVTKTIVTEFDTLKHPRGFFYIYSTTKTWEDGVSSFNYDIIDKDGVTIFSKKKITNERVFVDTLLEENECYTFVLTVNRNNTTDDSIGILNFITSDEITDVTVVKAVVGSPIGLNNPRNISVKVIGPNEANGLVTLSKQPYLLIAEGKFRYIFPS